MPASLAFETYGEALGDATAVIRNNAAAAGLTAPVPTCPGWTVRDLVVHQGVVHRWATAILSGRSDFDEPTAEASGRAAADLLEWLDDGLVDLLNALAPAPEDLDVWFFLMDAGRPRDAWARRQAHETTMHAVDAMSARLGRPPAARELWFTPSFAADGLDELLFGFLPRPKTQLRTAKPSRIAFRTTDVPGGWTVEVTEDSARTRAGADSDADLTVSGTARELYLAAWNRGDEMALSGDLTLWATWRDLMTVIW